MKTWLTILGMFFGACAGYLSGKYAPIIGGFLNMGDIGSEAHNLVVRQHIVIGTILFGLIGLGIGFGTQTLSESGRDVVLSLVAGLSIGLFATIAIQIQNTVRWRDGNLYVGLSGDTGLFPTVDSRQRPIFEPKLLFIPITLAGLFGTVAVAIGSARAAAKITWQGR